MAYTVGIHKKNMSDSKISFQNVMSTLPETFPEKIDSAIRVMEERAKAFANILSNRRKTKFQRDKIDLERALNSSNKILQQLMNNKTPVLNEKHLREKLLEGQKISSFESPNLQEIDTPFTAGLISLCSKDSSFVPFPPHYSQLQLQKDFDKFRNNLRSRVFFAKKEQNSNNNFRNNNEVNNQPKKKSNWSSPKANSPELETFLISVERNLFCNTKGNDVKDV